MTPHRAARGLRLGFMLLAIAWITSVSAAITGTVEVARGQHYSRADIMILTWIGPVLLSVLIISHRALSHQARIMAHMMLFIARAGIADGIAAELQRQRDNAANN